VKKLSSIILILCLIMGTVAFSETLTYATKKGQYASTKTKTTGIGTDATVDITSNSGKHSMYYQVRKPSGYECSNYLNTNQVKEISLSYRLDGNGESLGRTGYQYKLRVAHRTQCSCSGAASVSLTWDP